MKTSRTKKSVIILSLNKEVVSKLEGAQKENIVGGMKPTYTLNIKCSPEDISYYMGCTSNSSLDLACG